ncbi:hypothetical protein AB0K60_36000 [Thermopolyspora sp. NPDC052614]|uniref:hypothetical protein n=1 Tax=Thermopolyspora sp. NPDC052614 TaxID=3155682 RepID=UPI003422EE10
MTAHLPLAPRTAHPAAELLDYYVVTDEHGDPEGLVVEEFAYNDDHTAAGIDGAAWTREERLWWSSADLTRRMRADPELRRRVSATTRREAEAVYRRLSGDDLPDEPNLRLSFRDRLALNTAAPLLLGPPEKPEGFTEKRVYRILFAGELTNDHLHDLRHLWRMTIPDDGPAPTRVAGTAHAHIGDDVFTWDLRRIGPRVAWSLDVTVHLRSPADDTVRSLLRELTTPMRHAGLIPVTVERFS